MPIAKNTTELICAHCSADTGKSPVWHENQIFCCEGCKTVYDILHKNNLCDFYQIDTEAAVSLKNKAQSKWSIEELNLMATDFTQYENGDLRTVLFHIPSMHCSSCIWLLEKLPDLNTGVTQSRSDFLKKQLKITYNQGVTSFGEIVIILRSLGYEPNLMPEDSQQSNYVENRSILIKLGVAGFCAGNIMMFSFPQYLGLDVAKDV
ncbi:MAG: heavy metal translocating P-type ATPase metal-binding domain-containing protein, partial [Bacteroidia bacterium]|nr:heavy metal translocating P-type ATPase metal-binding domain-containing protein [Bacteroidia bacterium]